MLAEGEATGHAHAIDLVDVPQRFVQAFTLADDFFIKVSGGVPVTVTHEEHKPVTINTGAWRVAIVREYNHFQKEAHRVID